MQIVIDIPEDTKNRLCFGITYQKDIQTICEALNDGTPISDNEPKTGHWIETEYHRWRCSVCREKGMSEWDNINDVRTNFCPNCGARMVEPQESEDKE